MANLRTALGFTSWEQARSARFSGTSRVACALGLLVASGSLSSCSGEASGVGAPAPPGGTGSSSALVNPVVPGSGAATTSAGTTPALPTGATTSVPGAATSAAPTQQGTAPPALAGLDVKTACPTAQLNPAPLRRLTRNEYTHTVHDLLGFDLNVAANFPPDEVEKNGFGNNAAALTFGKSHVLEHLKASETLAKEAVKNVTTLAPCASSTTEAAATACAKTFIHSFGRKVFRRTVTDADEQMLLQAYAAGATGGSYAEGIEVTLRAMLQSPDFLYRLEVTPSASASDKLVPLNGFELATRLSYAFWGTTPDAGLLDAAEAGMLKSKDQVAAMTRKMIADTRAHSGLTEFYNQWLTTDRLSSITKDAAAFPLFTADARADMTAELASFIDYVMGASGDHKLKTLLTANAAFPGAGLAPIYNTKAGTGALLKPDDSQGRAGLLTLPAFLSVMAHPDQTSPVLRGAFVRAKLLCTPPPRPPDNVDITPPEPKERPTARERLSAHLSAGEGCMGCHQSMDPIGFAFENFDAVGAWREKENNVTIDASGEIIGTAGLEGGFMGVRGLADKLAASDIVRDCVATQWFRFASGRYENPGDSCTLATMQDTFAKTDGDLIELLVQMTQTDAFLNRAQVEVSP